MKARARLLAAMLLAGLVLASSAPAMAEGHPRVTVETGALEGVSQGASDAFLGIPFAAPPVGSLRWRAPQPAPAWHGTRKASSFASDCMQAPMPNSPAPVVAPLSEDCLYLNVWRPAGARAGAKLPVVVWLHGGGNVNGGTSPGVYSGAAFARDGVVFVSIGWRLGRFGFFGFPALTRQDADHGMLGNYGYMDVLAGLGWVRRNIASFGGDPAHVTIYGQSAGASAVAAMLATPLAKGLFSQAIMQSDGNERNDPRPWTGNPAAQIPQIGIEQAGINFARRWSIEGTGPEALARLRTLSAAQVTDGLNLGTVSEQRDRFAGPVQDGHLLTETLIHALEGGRAAQVPLLIGSTSADNSGAMRATTLESAFATAFAHDADEARAAYAPLTAGDPAYALREMGRDIGYREPARHISALLLAQGQPVFDYRFGYVADVMHQEWPEGPPHATDIPYAMDTLRAKYDTTTSLLDAEVARKMHQYWVNFIRSGNPNGPQLAVWPVFTPRDDVLMRFAVDGSATAVPDPARQRLDAVAAARR